MVSICEITVSDVLAQLRKLDVSKATGPDGIPEKLPPNEDTIVQ